MPSVLTEDFLEKVPNIASDARYWFVRTDGGDLYNAFTATNSIAIAYRSITSKFVRSLELKEDKSDLTLSARETLKNEIKKHYPRVEKTDTKNYDRSGLAASQLLSFCSLMKKGDVVIIPSTNTDRLSFGFVADDKPYTEKLKYAGESFPEYTKRRKVRWVRGLTKFEINPYLFKLFLNHQAIVEATPYSEWIDALLYEFFSKGDEYHFVLKVRTGESIPAQDLFRACLDLFDLAKEFAETKGIELDTADIKTRINLNSPGDVEFWKKGYKTTLLISAMIIAINGGGLTIQKAGLELKTPGLVTEVTEFLNAKEKREEREAVRAKLEKLKIETPAQVIDLLKASETDKQDAAEAKKPEPTEAKKPSTK